MPMKAPFMFTIFKLNIWVSGGNVFEPRSKGIHLTLQIGPAHFEISFWNCRFPTARAYWRRD